MLESEPVELVFEGPAKDALTKIAQLLGDSTTEDEAVQRAIGTELFLLEKIKEGATLVLQWKHGEREEVDLFG